MTQRLRDDITAALDIISALEAEGPLSEQVITRLAGGISTDGTCGGWPASIGEAIIARFRRERAVIIRTGPRGQ